MDEEKDEKRKTVEALCQVIVNALTNEEPAKPVLVDGRPPQKYAIGERVQASGWVSSDFGTVEDISWIYHSRLNEYAWGYRIKFEGEGPGLTFTYIPEGYLGKS